MGDRRQVHITNLNLWIYSHWSGSVLPEIVHSAVQAAEPRWQDVSYCSRIIAMKIMEDCSSGETGCGLSNESMDSEYKHDIEINTQEHTVTIGPNTWTFEEYLKISDLEMTLRELGEDE